MPVNCLFGSAVHLIVGKAWRGPAINRAESRQAADWAMAAMITDDISSDLRWLLGAVARGLVQSGGADVMPVLAALAGQDIADAAVIPPAPRAPAVTAHLAPAIAEAVLSQPEVAAALASLSDNLHWLDGEDEAVLSPLIGPNGFVAGSDVRLDLVLLAPSARQGLPLPSGQGVWWPLTGPSRWVNGHELTLAPGSVAHAGGGNAPVVMAGRLPLLGLWLVDASA